MLEGDYHWSQQQTPDEAAAGKPHHTTWLQIRSYLIDANDTEEWSTWAVGQDWNGRWMPESGSPTRLLLADHPYKSDWPNLDDHDQTTDHGTPLPGPFVVTTTRYGGVNDWDQSDSKYLYTYMPSTTFCRALSLHRVGEFQWGQADVPIVESFAVRETGPDTVHVCAEPLGAALVTNRKHLLWTVLGEKQTSTRTDYRSPDHGQPITRSYSASYLFDGAQIRLLDGSAQTLYVGGDKSDTIGWSLQTNIAVVGG